MNKELMEFLASFPTINFTPQEKAASSEAELQAEPAKATEQGGSGATD